MDKEDKSGGGRGVVRRGSCATSVKLDRETIVGLSYCSPFLPPYTRRKGVRAKNFVGETMKSNRNVACDISFFTGLSSVFDTRKLISILIMMKRNKNLFFFSIIKTMILILVSVN